MSEHAGTHITAAASFFAGGRTVDDYSLKELIRPAVVLDVQESCRSNSDYALTVEELSRWEQRHGIVPSGSLVFLLTGWSNRWNDPEDYLHEDSNGILHFPGFGLDAAELLVNERMVAGLGTDTAGVEPGVDRDFSVSRLVLGQNLIVLENLANLEQLPPTGSVAVVGPLLLVGASGSPASVTAFVPS